MSCAFSCLKGRHHAVGNFEGWFGITGTIPKCRNLQFGGSLYFSKISVVNLTLYFLLKEFRIGFDRRTFLFQGVFLKHEIRGSDVDQSGHDQRPNRLRGHYRSWGGPSTNVVIPNITIKYYQQVVKIIPKVRFMCLACPHYSLKKTYKDMCVGWCFISSRFSSHFSSWDDDPSWVSRMMVSWWPWIRGMPRSYRSRAWDQENCDLSSNKPGNLPSKWTVRTWTSPFFFVETNLPTSIWQGLY
jgi:hypothetical protein